MMRVSTKIGDIFSVKVDNNTKKYFQLIAFDLTQLNSDVIRAFKKSYPFDATTELYVIVNDDVEFYVHCSTKIGLKLGLWEKAGNITDVGQIDNILFRSTNDYGKHVSISKDWWVWKINEPQLYVGKLEGENRKAEIGLVFAPQRIINRIQTGQYGIPYPEFE